MAQKNEPQGDPSLAFLVKGHILGSQTFIRPRLTPSDTIRELCV